MEAVFRSYKQSDYISCECLTNEAWDFDELFESQELADLARRIYTKGPAMEGNYRFVVEVEGQVVGFIFGLNELSKKSWKKYLFGLSAVWRLMRIKTNRPDERKNFMNALAAHEKNRRSVVESGRSEILLFVVGRQFQGLGYGTTLWSGFKTFCESSGVVQIVVETNRLGASGFYEKLGFTEKGDFCSPLHEYATEGGQACIYEYKCA